MTAPAAGEDTVDYDIHGLVGVRLLDPRPRDAAAVARQLGPLRRPLRRQPDITVRFVERLGLDRMCQVTRGENGFDDHGFYVLRNRNEAVRVRVPFDQIGGRCEIVCQSGVPAVPLLITIVNLAMLRRDCVSLHASAFVHDGVGILVTGWAKGGKTEALLSFIARGAAYVGDEWIQLSGDGKAMYGIPEAITLRDWHIDQVPEIRGRLDRGRLRRFAALRWAQRAQQWALASPLGRTPLGRVLRRSVPVLERELRVRLEPAEIFGQRVGSYTARPEKVFLMVSQDQAEIGVEPVDPGTVADRMVASIHFEQIPFLEHYLAFRYAFPERRNGFLEGVPGMQAEILRRALEGKDAYLVRHPYPVSFAELFRHMQPFCARGTTDASR